MVVSVHDLVWERVEIASEGGEMHAVTAGGPGLVAVGLRVLAGGSGRAGVWVSDDGFGWREIEDDSFFGSGGAWMSSVTVGGPGLVAVGVDTDGDRPGGSVWDPAVWV